MATMEYYLYGSYAVALIAIIGYQLFVQARLKELAAKVAIIREDSAAPRREVAS